MSPEAKQGYRMLWEEVVPFLYFGAHTGGIIGLGLAAYSHHLLAMIAATVGLVITGWLTASWSYSTRWTGRPVVLITAEAAKAIQEGRYSLNTKEQIH